MFTSEPELLAKAHVRGADLTVSSRLDALEVTVMDARFGVAAHGFGELTATLEPGIYEIRLRAGAIEQSRLVTVDPSSVRDEHIAWDVPIAAPFAGFGSATHALAAARRGSRSLKGEGGLVVVVSAADADAAPFLVDALDRIAVVGQTLEDLGGVWDVTPAVQGATLSTTLQEGGLALRLLHRDVTTERTGGIERSTFEYLSLWVTPGWRTVVYLPFAASGPRLGDASVHMARSTQPDQPADGPDHSAIALETVLSGLRVGRPPVPRNLVKSITAPRRENPMLGLAAAHALLAQGQPDWDLFDEVLTSLHHLLGDHPDLAGLAWLARERRFNAPVRLRDALSQPRVTWPPMFLASYEALLRLDAQLASDPVLSLVTSRRRLRARGSAAELAAANLVPTGIWTSWRAPAALGRTVGVEALDAPGDHPGADGPAQLRVDHYVRGVAAAQRILEDDAPQRVTVRQVALATGLPAERVRRALEALRHRFREEARLRRVLLIVSALMAVAAAFYVPDVFTGAGVTRAYAINSVTLYGLVSVLAGQAAADLRGRLRLVRLVIGVQALIVGLVALAIVTGSSSFGVWPRWLGRVDQALIPASGVRAVIWLAGAGAIAAVLGLLLGQAARARFGLRFLGPLEHATLAAVAEAILSEPEVAPTEIATAVDQCFAALDTTEKRQIRITLRLLALLPLRSLKPPLFLMAPSARRRFLQRQFIADPKAQVGPLRIVVQSALRFAMQMVYVGYYGDPRSYRSTGFVPSSHVPGYEPTNRPSQPVRTFSPGWIQQSRIRADVVVIGSGAGGSMVAAELAHQGRDVLVLERGPYVKPSQFGSDEVARGMHMYADGALPSTLAVTARDFGLQVLQGMCVGGSTVLNYGILDELPPEVLARWNSASYDAGLPEHDLKRSFEAVRAKFDQVRREDLSVTPTWARLRDELPLSPATELSTLLTLLPGAQRETDELGTEDSEFRGRLEILPRCEVTNILHTRGHAIGVRCAVRYPDGTSRKREILANSVCLAAGAIQSSRLLMASGIGGPAVGRGLCANLASPMTAYWSGEPVRAYEGFQVSRYEDWGPVAIQTWFNPVVTQALAMPGWFEDHERNMRRYDHLACLRVLIASTGLGNRVRRRRGWLSGSEISFAPTADDLHLLLRGLRAAGKLLLEAGAECVMPATFAYRELRTAEELAGLDIGMLVRDPADISIATEHPQGGNAISRDQRRGVVDETLRVHGFTNLHVCDASVFPTAITVSPQFTIMALAHYAASGMV